MVPPLSANDGSGHQTAGHEGVHSLYMITVATRWGLVTNYSVSEHVAGEQRATVESTVQRLEKGRGRKAAAQEDNGGRR